MTFRLHKDCISPKQGKGCKIMILIVHVLEMSMVPTATTTLLRRHCDRGFQYSKPCDIITAI